MSYYYVTNSQTPQQGQAQPQSPVLLPYGTQMVSQIIPQQQQQDQHNVQQLQCLSLPIATQFTPVLHVPQQVSQTQLSTQPVHVVGQNLQLQPQPQPVHNVTQLTNVPQVPNVTQVPNIAQVPNVTQVSNVPQLPVVQVYQPWDPQPLVPLSPQQPVITSVTGTEIIPPSIPMQTSSLAVQTPPRTVSSNGTAFTSPVQSELQRLSTPIENQMTKLESDIQTLLTLMMKNVSSNEQQTEVVNKQHEQPPENTKPITGTIASIAQGNHVHQAT